MQQEIRFATFNVCNLAPPGMTFYANLPAYTEAEYDGKLNWLARQLDRLDADVIALQEIFAQAAVRDVLARTEKYRDAFHVGADPDSEISPLTPSVALVSRLPLSDMRLIHDLPPGQLAGLPQAPLLPRFTRPLLSVSVGAPNGQAIRVVVVHLKSKRPDYHAGEDESDPQRFALASLRSLYRRGTEALGLHFLLQQAMQTEDMPLIVLGDFNDTAEAVTTQIVMGAGRTGEEAFAQRLFDCRRIQRGDLSRRTGFTHMHDGSFNTIDHILTSKHFHPEYANACGAVQEVIYLSDHLTWREPHASDHGIVLVRIALRTTAGEGGEQTGHQAAGRPSS